MDDAVGVLREHAHARQLRLGMLHGPVVAGGALALLLLGERDQVVVVPCSTRTHGGRYRLTMCGPDAVGRTVVGEYLQVDPPHRLAYTWMWEQSDGPAVGVRTVVTVEFRAVGEGTSVVLTQSGFPVADLRDSTARMAGLHGWPRRERRPPPADPHACDPW